MNLPRLDFISLRLRVSLGFIFICIILIVVGIFSYLGFSQSKDHFLDLTSINEQARLHINIERDVSELQGRVQQYIYEGRKFTEGKIHELFKTISEDLKTAHESTGREIAKGFIINIIEQLNLYSEAFSQVVEERKLRTDLVENKLVTDSKLSEDSLLRYIKLEDEKGNIGHVSKAHMIMNSLLSIGKQTFTYFETLDSTLVTETKRIFNDIRSSISKLIEDEEEMLLLREIQRIISRYEYEWFRAVQATRGYLYLVNVVLAGEASEILHNTDRLKKISINDMDIVHKQSALLLQKSIFFTIIMTVVTVIIGVVISWLIARSVIVPINRLTKVFKLLAKGDHSSNIPSRDLKDEIGDLSRAAEVFRNKNIQTEQLLKKSEVLTADLEERTNDLARSNDELEQFVYTVSHDLKSPLVTSMGFISMIKDIAKKGEYEKAVSKLDQVVQANNRMGQLINDLLDLSRVGRIDTEKKHHDMNVLLEDLRETMEHKLKKEQFELVLENELPSLYINESRILQLFENMMSNTFKYARNPSGKNIVKIGSRKDGDADLIYITDSGPGIPEEYHEKIFVLFYKLDNSIEGTGVGLSVVRKVMQFHCGRVWVESKAGHGATFWLEFPRN